MQEYEYNNLLTKKRVKDGFSEFEWELHLGFCEIIWKSTEVSLFTLFLQIVVFFYDLLHFFTTYCFYSVNNFFDCIVCSW